MQAELALYNVGIEIFQFYFTLMQNQFYYNTRYCWQAVDPFNIACKQTKYNLDMHGTVILQKTWNLILTITSLSLNHSLHVNVSCFTYPLRKEQLLQTYCMCIQMCPLFTQSRISELQATANILLTHVQLSIWINIDCHTDKPKLKIFWATWLLQILKD